MANVEIEKRNDRLTGMLGRESFQQSLAAVMPRHMTPSRIVKMVMVAASKNPTIFKCTEISICKAVMTAGELGLDCSGTMGQGYIVPFYSGKTKSFEAEFIPGYQGLIDLARRSGSVLDINPVCVYENDTFSIDFGREQVIQHSPQLAGDRGKPKCFYAIAWLVGNPRPHVEFMTLGEVERIKSMTKSKNKQGEIVGPWKDHFVEMGRKTTVRRIAKYIPKSPELQHALEIDNQNFDLGGPAIDITAKVDEIQSRMAKARQAAPKPPKADAAPKPAEEPEKAAETATAHEAGTSGIPDDVFGKMGLSASNRPDAKRAWLLAMGDDTAPDWNSRKFLAEHGRLWGEAESPLKGLDALVTILENEAGEK